ncbi:fungal-specific transcription factor domain-containing protein [Boeremia exigua]|uniref:fungal-specific transcription factor domain-containing protein n=1 Tax=Boeremia exigua TaxID=749465 RepID=UPI001E8ECB18|nr:fungal-specific transcription factor domain-containing protein [Boeremia exigua]KAH6639093.1 fungal-specific transcription factor domain-containing protein [Boeremia exigua]
MSLNMGEAADTSLEKLAGKRACENCRVKKIRCNKAEPCSHCRASKTICQTVEPVQKTQKQRVHISEEYERKIDRLEGQLNSINEALFLIASRLDEKEAHVVSREQISQRIPSAVQKPLNDSTTETDALAPVPYEGETGISTQSGYVRELLVQAVGGTPSVGRNAEVNSSLAALEKLVTQQKNCDTVSIRSTIRPLIDRSLAATDIANLARPPWSVVRIAIDKATKHPTMIFAALFSMLKMENLREIIEDSYHHPVICGAPRRLLAYGVLFNIFTEYSVVPWPGIDKTSLVEYASMSRTHLEVAISQLDMFLPASYESIMALSVGTACAVEMCKPSLAWVLIANAAERCKSLGYHRFETMRNDPEEDQRSKIHLFWMIFMFDKQLSLRLGRASTIQDWDVSLPLLATKKTPVNSFEESNMIVYWVKVAKIQGQVYEKLFSPATFTKSPSARCQTARNLVDSMNQAWKERGSASVMDFTNLLSPNETELPSKRKRVSHEASRTALLPDDYMQSSFDQVEDVFFHTDVVVHYSTCALVLRALSPDSNTFNEECLEYSRAALVAHMRCNSQFNTKATTQLWSGYIHWSILQAPITPFMALFCNAIYNTDRTDLNSLTGFVSSLESCRKVSEGAESLYKMCLLFLKIAEIYIEAKEKEVRDTQMHILTHEEPYRTNGPPMDAVYHITTAQFDPHLSALGLASNSASSLADYPPGLNSQAPGDYAAGQVPIGSSGSQFPDLGYTSMSAYQSSIQDWFSGSRYLINLMDVDSDLQMPDISNTYLQ